MGNCAGILGMCNGDEEHIRVSKDRMQEAIIINKEQEF